MLENTGLTLEHMISAAELRTPRERKAYLAAALGVTKSTISQRKRWVVKRY